MITQFNRRVLIDLFIWNDDQNSSRHIIYVRQAGPGCWARRAGGQGVTEGGWGQGGFWAGRSGPRAWLGPWQHSGGTARPWAAQQPGRACSQVLLWSEVWGSGCQGPAS